MQFKVIPSITTHGLTSSNWRNKIAEIPKLNLREVGLFVTGLSVAERLECFHLLRALQARHYFTVPFVHAVSDMQEHEYRFLMDYLGTERFNLHPESDFKIVWPLTVATKRKIYIENCYLSKALLAKDLDGFAGLCLDLSHLEDSRRYAPEVCESLVRLAQHFSVGANHISAVPVVDSLKNSQPQASDSSHVFKLESDFSYLSTVPSHCIAKLCALELENSLVEQQQIISTVTMQLSATGKFLFKKAA